MRWKPTISSAAARGTRPLPERITLRTGKGAFARLDPEEILWVDAARNYVRLNTTEGALRVRCSMQWLEERLQPQRFLRIHRSTLVSLRRIREVHSHRGEDFVVLDNGQRLNVGRTYRDDLQEILAAEAG